MAKITYHQHNNAEVHVHVTDETGRVTDHTSIATINELLSPESRHFYAERIVNALNTSAQLAEENAKLRDQKVRLIKFVQKVSVLSLHRKTITCTVHCGANDILAAIAAEDTAPATDAQRVALTDKVLNDPSTTFAPLEQVERKIAAEDKKGEPNEDA